MEPAVTIKAMILICAILVLWFDQRRSAKKR